MKSLPAVLIILLAVGSHCNRRAKPLFRTEQIDSPRSFDLSTFSPLMDLLPPGWAKHVKYFMSTIGSLGGTGDSNIMNNHPPVKADKFYDPYRGFVCRKKVEMIEKVVWKESKQCTQFEEEECYQAYKTVLEFEKVVKCKTVFAKVCQLGHRDKSEKRTIKVCLRRKVRDCGIEGPEVCSKEKEMVCETASPHSHYSQSKEDQPAPTTNWDQIGQGVMDMIGSMTESWANNKDSPMQMLEDMMSKVTEWSGNNPDSPLKMLVSLMKEIILEDIMNNPESPLQMMGDLMTKPMGNIQESPLEIMGNIMTRVIDPSGDNQESPLKMLGNLMTAPMGKNQESPMEMFGNLMTGPLGKNQETPLEMLGNLMTGPLGKNQESPLEMLGNLMTGPVGKNQETPMEMLADLMTGPMGKNQESMLEMLGNFMTGPLGKNRESPMEMLAELMTGPVGKNQHSPMEMLGNLMTGPVGKNQESPLEMLGNLMTGPLGKNQESPMDMLEYVMTRDQDPSGNNKKSPLQMLRDFMTGPVGKNQESPLEMLGHLMKKPLGKNQESPMEMLDDLMLKPLREKQELPPMLRDLLKEFNASASKRRAKRIKDEDDTFEEEVTVEKTEDGCEIIKTKTCKPSTSDDFLLCHIDEHKHCPEDQSLLHAEFPETSCKQIERTVCGPMNCPIVENELECKNETKWVTVALPYEQCKMQPEKKCETVSIPIPVLVPEQKCQIIPKPICHSVDIPKRVMRPQVVDWCQTQPRETLIVLTGFDENDLPTSTSEVLDLSGKHSHHPQNRLTRVGKAKTFQALAKLFPGYPFETACAVGGFADGRIIVCGGVQLGSFCLGFDPGERLWYKIGQTRAKIGSAAAVLEDKVLFASGGMDASGLITRNSIFVSPTKIHYGPPLPEPLFGHCAVGINKTHVFIAGGISGNDYKPTNKAWILNVRTGKFKQVNHFADPRFAHVCGFVTDLHGNKAIAVAGGNGDGGLTISTPIFVLSELKWGLAPPIPEPTHSAGVVQFNNTILVIGGADANGGKLKSIFELNCEEENWVKWKVSLEDPRSAMVAVTVPEAFLGH